MKTSRCVRALASAATLALAALCTAQVFGQALARAPQKEAGDSITGSFEGWYQNKDGTFSMRVGYYNRNLKQDVDIPIGPNNNIEPGGPDRGQPTHFVPGRGWGMFTVTVPADFGEGKLTWTLTANGITTSIPLSLKPDWQISPFSEASVGNTPPVLRFDEKGPSIQGPGQYSADRTAKVGTPLSLTAWISDDAKWTSNSGAKPRTLPPAVRLRWTTYRGPAAVKFANERPPVEGADKAEEGKPFSGKATTTATFSEPGDYVLHLMVNDFSGEGGAGFQCCWTTGQVKVSVKP
jgi:hypothetical protein